MHRLIVTTLLLALMLTVFSQEDRGFRYYDSLTYNQYLESDWKSLSKSSSEAISNGHDYYYMRMRKAVSLYERQYYRYAVKHFLKAIEFNDGDPVAGEYLYYCYLFSGNESNAMAVAGAFPENKINDTGPDAVRKNSISLNTAYNNSVSDDIISDIEGLYGYEQEGNSVVSGYYMNTSLTATHFLSPGIRLIHSATYLRKQNFLYYFDGTTGAWLNNQDVNQFQYYLSPVLSTVNGWRFAPSIHFIATSYPLLGINYAGARTSAFSFNVNDNSIIAGLNLEKTIGIIDMAIAGHYSGLGEEQQLQAKAGVKISPLGNSKLYVGYSHYLVDNESFRGSDLQHINEVYAGFSIKYRIWIDFYLLTGQLYNFHTSNGMYVYNDSDISDLMTRLDLSIPVGINGTLVYLGASYGRSYPTFFPADIRMPESGDDYYNNISISGGLSWKF